MKSIKNTLVLSYKNTLVLSYKNTLVLSYKNTLVLSCKNTKSNSQDDPLYDSNCIFKFISNQPHLFLFASE
jgi:hypothetical protein